MNIGKISRKIKNKRNYNSRMKLKNLRIIQKSRNFRTKMLKSGRIRKLYIISKIQTRKINNQKSRNKYLKIKIINNNRCNNFKINTQNQIRKIKRKLSQIRKIKTSNHNKYNNSKNPIILKKRKLRKKKTRKKNNNNNKKKKKNNKKIPIKVLKFKIKHSSQNHKPFQPESSIL